MSPTMTEGTIHQWKIKEGQAFSAGDILLELETDKAQIDVEAPDDGVMAKIIMGDGQKGAVNSLIALLAEEGDDLSNVEIPQDDAPAPAAAAVEEKQQAAPAVNVAVALTPMDHHALDTSGLKKPLSPSVLGLVLRHHIKDLSAIKASGPGGRILKGDVLGHLGLIAPQPAPKPRHSVAPPRDQIEFAKPAQVEEKVKTPAKLVVPDYIERQITFDALFGFRDQLNVSNGSNVTVNDLVAEAATRALQEVNGGKLPKRNDKGVVYQTLPSAFASKIFHLAAPTYDFITDSYGGSKPFVLQIKGVQRQQGRQPESMVDIIDFLGGQDKKPAARSVTLKSQWGPAAAGPRYPIDIQLKGSKQISGDKKAKDFLDRLEYYIRHPEEILA
ncbi:hypothetical protein DM01DRAFT_1406397 [Hesseltinella vesiculosa]|uniref:Single hybrid motif-containing protein n=1 Tax=Hesseltinella vesiculosa TaxID=101127 RepID=A0A1X2GLZ2_9FUNG|nr:hypothetical protein DM01DRAFT_1406397 [Hesseltinella vesiculosa]